MSKKHILIISKGFRNDEQKQIQLKKYITQLLSKYKGLKFYKKFPAADYVYDTFDAELDKGDINSYINNIVNYVDEYLILSTDKLDIEHEYILINEDNFMNIIDKFMFSDASETKYEVNDVIKTLGANINKLQIDINEFINKMDNNGLIIQNENLKIIVIPDKKDIKEYLTDDPNVVVLKMKDAIRLALLSILTESSIIKIINNGGINENENEKK